MAKMKARRTGTKGTGTKATKRSALVRRATAALDSRKLDAVVGGKKAQNELKVTQAQIEAMLTEIQGAQQDLGQSQPKS